MEVKVVVEGWVGVLKMVDPEPNLEGVEVVEAEEKPVPEGVESVLGPKPKDIWLVEEEEGGLEEGGKSLGICLEKDDVEGGEGDDNKCW